MIETYIPLYRKYRPQKLADLVGQEVIATALENAFALNKIAHAYLFCGSRGTGKTSTARIMAKSLNCQFGPTATPCQTCASCQAITQGTALDVMEIDAASNNGVDNIRDLTDKVQFTPIQGKYKIYIIDEVHMLSTAAFNALLKTLEEPPPNVVFIFATTEAHKVLPTIISRCQRFDFSRITREQIEGRLAYIAEQEGISIQPEALTLIARHSKGGMRDALAMLDQVAVLGKSGSQQAIDPSVVLAFIGALESDVLIALTQAIRDKAPEQVLSEIRHLQEKGIDPGQMTKGLMEHFRNLLLAKTCGASTDPTLLDISPDLYAKLLAQAEGFLPEEIPQFLNRLAQLETQIRHSREPQLWFEVAMLDLAYRQDILVVQQLTERVAQLEARLLQGSPSAHLPQQPTMPQQAPMPAQQPPSKPPYTSKPKPVSNTVVEAPAPAPTSPPMAVEAPQSVPTAAPAGEGNLEQVWQTVMHAVEHLPTRALVQDHFFLLQMGEAEVLVGYSKDALYGTFSRAPEKAGYLEAAFQKVLARPVRLKFEKKEMVAKQPQAQAPSAPPAPATSPQLTAPSAGYADPVSGGYEVPAAVAVVSPPQPMTAVAPSAPGPSDPALETSKQYTQELFQGRILD